ncbi:ATP-binding protein [Streptomyces sp. NPDC046887]|uniref:ATP-binding protein n=1 Tax=Streptomyces sp. NPDC046887 TaxID=3155472 RepID=UPI0033E374BD
MLMALVTPPPSGGYRLTAPNAPTTAKLARDWVCLVLRGLGRAELLEPARLCVSEAVANVYAHTRSPQVEVLVDVPAGERAAVTFGVRDDGGGAVLPYVRETSAEREGGRGLLLLDVYAQAWGVRVGAALGGTPGPGGGADGKEVWFRLAAAVA